MATVKVVVRFVAFAWLLSLPWLTVMRAPIWRSDVTLWADAANGSAKPRPWINLGSALIAAQRLPEASLILDHAKRLSETRAEHEARLSDAYAFVIQAELLEVSGQWQESQARARNIQQVMGPLWTPGLELCARLRC